MTLPTASLLEGLAAASDCTAAAEAEYRRETAQRMKALERERIFAARRFNLVRAVADVVADAESGEIAAARALAVLRTRLGWVSDSDARSAVLSRFAPVAEALFRGLAREEAALFADPSRELAEFEDWYAKTHPNPFWALFENYMPETPLVDF
jgi:hypothetical protein